jgi:hypothetical protein
MDEKNQTKENQIREKIADLKDLAELRDDVGAISGAQLEEALNIVIELFELLQQKGTNDGE